MVKKIAISTNKGGVLKTSLCVNMAGVWAQKEKRVLLVDTDNQGNVLLSFGNNPDEVEHTVYDVMMGTVSIEDAIISVYPGIDILPSNDDLSFFEFDVLTNIEKYPNPFNLLSRGLKELKREYDYIIMDTPPSLGLMQGNVLTSVQDVLIPFQPESYSMRSLVKILKAIHTFKEDNNPLLEVRAVVPTLVDQRTTLHSDVLQECRIYCLENDIPITETVIPRTIRYANSIGYEGLPATLTVKKNKLIQVYLDLCEELY